MRLIKLKFPEIKISKLRVNNKVKNNSKYYFSILSDSLDFYAKNIGSDHEQKIKDLLFNIKRIELDNRHHQNMNTSNKILFELSKNNLTAKQLSRKFYLRHSYILKHLNNLKKDNKIEIINKDGFGYMWCIKT